MDGDRSEVGNFEALAMPLLPRLYNLAHWLAQDRDEAEDLVQETCLKALRGFAGFTPGTNFRAWIYRILRNTFLTSRTGLKAVAMVSLDDEDADGALEPATDETPETRLLVGATGEMIRSALEALPVHFREVILLADVEEMSYQEIAATLAVPIGTVMSRLSRARRSMRAALGRQVQGTSHEMRMVRPTRSAG